MSVLDRSEGKRSALYNEYSNRLVEIYNQMIDMVNQEVIPMLVKGIAQKSLKPDGWITTPGNELKPQTCWLMYDNETFDDDTTVWCLFLSDGKAVVSTKSKNKDDTWNYNDRISFCHDDRTANHKIFYFVKLFDGMMEIAKKCGFTNRAIRNKFYLLYAQYCITENTRKHQTGRTDIDTWY